jgi:uncharacterized membrane protein
VRQRLWGTAGPAFCALLASAAVVPMASGSDAEESPQAFYTERIKPMIAESCLRCHGPTRQRAGLRLDSREAVLRGGHSAIVVPGDPSKSRLIDALAYEDEDLQMPPDGKLTAAEIADFTKWVQLGVPWSEEPKPVPLSDADGRSPMASPSQAPPRAKAESHAPGVLGSPGRLHPLAVHLPIALLLMAAMAEMTSMILRRSGRTAHVRSCEVYAAISTIAGSAAAVFAMGLGWVLYLSTPELRGQLAFWHGCMGTATSVLAAGASAALILATIRSSPGWRAAYRALIAMVALSIAVTAHLGGSLVYGLHYLF